MSRAIEHESAANHPNRGAAPNPLHRHRAVVAADVAHCGRRMIFARDELGALGEPGRARTAVGDLREASAAARSRDAGAASPSGAARASARNRRTVRLPGTKAPGRSPRKAARIVGEPLGSYRAHAAQEDAEAWAPLRDADGRSDGARGLLALVEERTESSPAVRRQPSSASSSSSKSSASSARGRPSARSARPCAGRASAAR